MKIKEANLRQIIREEIFVSVISEQTPQQITRIESELKKIMTDPAEADRILVALRHIASPSTKDDRREDYVALGHALVDMLNTKDSGTITKLMMLMKKMASEKTAEHR